tara:strand:- start:5171 stop:5938 length:768 start_codon:yes stop_codon:yes gene_type:complete
MTKEEWIRNSTISLMSLSPGYDYDTAKVEIAAYLANTAGGWNPNDVGDPNGEGAPTNNNTPEQAATAINALEISETRTLTATVDVSLKITQTGSFASGTSTTAVVNALKALMETRIETELGSSAGIEFVDADWDNATTSEREGGALNSTQRVAVQTSITTDPVLVDPAAIASAYVRNRYSLDNTWIAKTIYNRGPNYPIMVTVRKYTTSSYATEDTTYIDGDDTVTYAEYVVQIDSNTHRVQTCSVYPPETRTPT